MAIEENIKENNCPIWDDSVSKQREYGKFYYRRGQSTGRYKQRSESVGETYNLDAKTTAVVRFLINAERFNSVADIYDAAMSFSDPKTFARHYNVNKSAVTDLALCADHRKIFWCKHANQWKIAAFYLDTPLDKALNHCMNRPLLTPWLGEDYEVIGCDNGATFAYTNNLMIDCIEICQGTLLNAKENTGFAFHDIQALQRLNKHISRLIV